MNGRVVGQVLAAYAGGAGRLSRRSIVASAGIRCCSTGDTAGLARAETGAPRDVIRQTPDALALVKVNSDSILMDIDTPEQYQRARYLAGLG